MDGKGREDRRRAGGAAARRARALDDRDGRRSTAHLEVPGSRELAEEPRRAPQRWPRARPERRHPRRQRERSGRPALQRRSGHPQVGQGNACPGPGARARPPSCRRKDRRTDRTAARVVEEVFGYRRHDVGARASNPGRRGRDAESGLGARLRARQVAAGASRDVASARIAGRLPGAEPERVTVRGSPSERERRPMMRVQASRFAWLLTAGVLALARCMYVAHPTKYYVLSPTSPRDPTPTSSASSVAVGVGPVLIPGYLDRVQIVTRDANDEVAGAMYDRWAEPLESVSRKCSRPIWTGTWGASGSRSFRGAAESRECSIIRWSSWYCASRAGPGGRRPWTRGGALSVRTATSSP